jgi:hypothetical protein
MTKTAFKHWKRASAFLSALSLVTPLMASAMVPLPVNRDTVRSTVGQAMGENRSERADEMREKMQQVFCTRFTEMAGKIGTGLAEGRDKFEERRNSRMEHIDDGRDTRDAKLGDSRSEADAKRSEMYAKLEEKADTDAKKDAVEEFQKTVEAAVETRREAVDAALQAFRIGVDAILSKRKDNMQNAADSFEAAMKTALEKAKQECEDGTSPDTVRAHFQAALQAAHKSLEADRNSSEKISDEIKALADTKHAAIEKAMNDFTATVKAAAEKLKTVMGEDKDTDA